MTRRQWIGTVGGASAALAVASTSAARASTPGGGGADPFRTRLVTDYGARYPIVNAGMSFIGLHQLAVAVAEAGGIGMYGAAPEPPPAVDYRLTQIRAGTSGVFGVDFIISSSALGDFTTQGHIDVAAGHAVPIVVFHFGLPTAAWVAQLHAAGSRVWVQVPDVLTATKAISVGADGLIAQGKNAGGHNHNSTIATLTLLQQIRAQVPGSYVLLAAGGICNGASLASALTAGADGGWMGTRFVSAAESYAHPTYKQLLVGPHPINSTVLTTAFGPEWSGQPQRVLHNSATDHPTATTPNPIGSTLLFPGVPIPGLGNSPYTMPNHSAIVPTRDTSGDFTQMDMPAGSDSILAVRAGQTAAQIIDEVMHDARQLLQHS